MKPDMNKCNISKTNIVSIQVPTVYNDIVLNTLIDVNCLNKSLLQENNANKIFSFSLPNAVEIIVLLREEMFVGFLLSDHLSSPGSSNKYRGLVFIEENPFPFPDTLYVCVRKVTQMYYVAPKQQNVRLLQVPQSLPNCMY